MGDFMEKPNISVHLLNFLLKYTLFLIIFLLFQWINLFTLQNRFLAIFPLLFTVIGIVADWIIVPYYHNMPSSIMGSIFMGSVTYLAAFFFKIGYVPLYSAILLAISLGIVEATLHRLIIKPYLKKT